MKWYFLSIYLLFVTSNNLYNQDWDFVLNKNENQNSNVNSLLMFDDDVILCTTNGLFKTNSLFSTFRQVGYSSIIFDKVFKFNSLLFALPRYTPQIPNSYGIYMSEDSGINWKYNNLGDVIVSDIIKNKDKFYAITKGNGLFSSLDNGISWQYISLNNYYLNTFKIINDIYFVGSSGLGLFISKNEGQDWNIISGDFFEVFQITTIKDTIFISTDNGIFVSLDYGNTWSEFGLQGLIIRNFEIMKNLFLASNYSILYFKNSLEINWNQTDFGDYINSINVNEDTLYLCSEKKIIKIFNNLQVRQFYNFFVEEINSLNDFNSSIIISSYKTGISKIISDLDNWLNLIQKRYILSFQSFNSEFYFSDENKSLFFTLDSGNTWKNYNCLELYERLADVNKDTLFFISNPYDGLNYNGVKYTYNYKDSLISPDFHFLETPTKEVVDFKIINNTYYIGTTSLGVFYSSDFGTSWNNIGFIGDPIFKLVVDKGRLFIITKKKIIYSSYDNIQNWNKLCNLDYSINTVLNYGNDYFIGSSYGIWRFNSNGILEKIGLNDIGVNSLIIKGEYLYAGTDIGLFRAKLSDFVSVGEKENIFEQVYLYPNPSTNILSFSQIPEGSFSYEIYDIFGLKRNEGKIERELNVEFLPSGVYFLKLNNQAKPIKFIKI